MAAHLKEAAANAANAAASGGMAAVGAERGIDWLFWGGLFVLGLQGLYWLSKLGLMWLRVHRGAAVDTGKGGL